MLIYLPTASVSQQPARAANGQPPFPRFPSPCVGQSHPNGPATSTAYMSPSIVALTVVLHERRYQIDI